MESTEARTMKFGSYELDVRLREFRTGSTRVRLQEQPFEILNLDAGASRRRRDARGLRQRLWPAGTYVDFEHSLNAAVKRLRAALGDDAENPRFVEHCRAAGVPVHRAARRRPGPDACVHSTRPASPRRAAVRESERGSGAG